MAKDWDDVKPKKKSVSPFARRPPQNEDEQFIVDLMSNALSNMEYEPARHEWRVSSFPICGMLHILKMLKNEPRQKPYSMDFYTSIGTAVHETIQYHLVNSPKTSDFMVGNFECKSCNWKSNIPSGTRRPIACPQCRNTKLHYIEIDFNVKGITGHLDGLIETPTRRYALEFKTTSAENVEDPSKYLPYSKHFFQIETYCLMLGLLYRKLPTHYAIIYKNRNAGFTQYAGSSRLPYYSFVYKVTTEMMEKRRRELLRTINARKIVNHIMQRPNRQLVSQLSDIRPCRSAEDYRLNMKPTFFGDENCPYAKSQTCWKKSQHGDIKPVNDIWSMLSNPNAVSDLFEAIPDSYDAEDF